MSDREYAKGGMLPTDGRIAPASVLAPDECFVRIPDDDDATWAPCVRRDPAHEGLCPGGMTVPSRRAVHGLLRGLPEGTAE